MFDHELFASYLHLDSHDFLSLWRTKERYKRKALRMQNEKQFPGLNWKWKNFSGNMILASNTNVWERIVRRANSVIDVEIDCWKVHEYSIQKIANIIAGIVSRKSTAQGNDFIPSCNGKNSTQASATYVPEYSEKRNFTKEICLKPTRWIPYPP